LNLGSHLFDASGRAAVSPVGLSRDTAHTVGAAIDVGAFELDSDEIFKSGLAGWLAI